MQVRSEHESRLEKMFYIAYTSKKMLRFACDSLTASGVRAFLLFFFFLLFHQLAEDEALIIFLQTSLFLVFPYAVDNCLHLS